MRPIQLLSALMMMWILIGCASKPHDVARADQAAIRERLGHFSSAWAAADPERLHDSFHIDTLERQQFVDAAGRLRLAQANLAQAQKALAASQGGTLPSPFADVNVADIPPYLREYARGARSPQKMHELKGVVTVDLPGDHRPQVRLSKDDAGAWKIDPASLTMTEPLAAVTHRLERQAAFTDEAAAATAANDAAKMKSLLQRYAQQEMIDRMSQSARQEVAPPGE
jgi:hypothetical protein